MCVMGMVAAGDMVFSITQLSVVQAEAVNARRLDLLLRSNLIDMERICVYGVHQRCVCGAGAGLCSNVGYGGGQVTGVGGVGVDEEAVVDMVGTSSYCFRVVEPLLCVHHHVGAK